MISYSSALKVLGSSSLPRSALITLNWTWTLEMLMGLHWWSAYYSWDHPAIFWQPVPVICSKGTICPDASPSYKRICAPPCQTKFVSNMAQVASSPYIAGPKEKLNSTVISQPAIYVASLAALEKLRQDKGDVSPNSFSSRSHVGVSHVRAAKALRQLCMPCCQRIMFSYLPALLVLASRRLSVCAWRQAAVDEADVTCGLSLGEYTALTYAGAIRSYLSQRNDSTLQYLFSYALLACLVPCKLAWSRSESHLSCTHLTACKHQVGPLPL